MRKEGITEGLGWEWGMVIRVLMVAVGSSQLLNEVLLDVEQLVVT